LNSYDKKYQKDLVTYLGNMLPAYFQRSSKQYACRSTGLADQEELLCILFAFKRFCPYTGARQLQADSTGIGKTVRTF
jgi:hypothetical protein